MVTRTSESRRPGTWTLVAMVTFTLVLMSVYAREGEGGPLHTVRRGVQTVTGPIAYAGDIVTTPFRGIARWFTGFTVSRQELDELRSQNAELRKRNAELEEAAVENDRLRALVGFAAAADIQAKGAHVIGRPATSWEGVITLDVGTEDGVTSGMPVLAAQGLVGQIVEVSPGSSRVRLITDQGSGVAAMIQRTRGTGIVHGSVDGGLTLDFLSRETTPQVGDAVITSGLGGIYPKGLLVGEITEVDLRANDLYPRVVVESRVPFTSIEEVLVLLSQQKASERTVVE